ncbi:MAG: proline--tRNA ligase [Dehalococcoidia bacterium]
MRMSQLFGRTLRQAPAEAETPNHRLLLRAALVQQLAAGIYSYLPLGWRAIRKIEQIIREEMDAAGGQELMMPALHPSEIWQESGRRQSMRDILFTVKDRRDRELVLGPTHEEITVELFKRHVQSYRDLPLLIYQIQTKFRDEPRPRGGLIRLREFSMKDLYSFDADWEGLDWSYRRMYDAYKNVFDRCGVPTASVLADSGAIGGKDSQEFMYLTEVGEDEALMCSACGYAANAEKAELRKRSPEPEEPLPVDEVSTPGIITIEDLARFLDIPHWKTLKAVFYIGDGQPVFVAIRGELEVNEVKLRNALGVTELHLMDDAEAARAGLEVGFASPIGLKNVRVVADDSAPGSPNLVAGANKPDTHLRNVNYGRDWTADIVADIALARHGDPCPNCGHPLELRRGIEMGHVFKIGTVYSEKMGATFLDRDGNVRPAVMGCYGIGLDRLLATIVEANHDERGIIWPPSVAPYDAHLVALNIEQPEVHQAAEKLHEDLAAAGIKVLYDDREESPGVKFNDADLLGMPLRVTVSPRTLEKDSAELKRRAEKEITLVPLGQAVEVVARQVQHALHRD